MSGSQVNSSDRTYSSPVRAEQAELTKRRITDAAYDLFLDRGYPATTIAQIAKAAGVTAQTVYNTFGSKPALLKRVYDIRLVGDEEPIPFGQRPDVIALYTQEDPAQFLEGYARLGRELMDRLGPLLLVVQAGAQAGDPDLAAHIDTTNGERLIGTGMAANRVQALNALRPGLTVERARDLIWTLNSVEVWHLLTSLRGWSSDEYAEWLGKAMCGAVLGR